jgi:hypothetical protein
MLRGIEKWGRKVLNPDIERFLYDNAVQFAKLDEDSNAYTISAFLLAQFGKNYAVENGTRISGTELVNVLVRMTERDTFNT